MSEQSDTIDHVEETWHDRQMDVKVEKVTRSGYREDQTILKVYGKRTDKYRSIEGNVERENTRFVKLAEFPATLADEILFGLAEARGYETNPK